MSKSKIYARTFQKIGTKSLALKGKIEKTSLVNVVRKQNVRNVLILLK